MATSAKKTTKKPSKGAAPRKPVKKQALGRGLAALIPESDLSFMPLASENGEKTRIREVPVAQIVANPDQPRRHFPQQELDELAASIGQHGILQPILLRPFEDVDGEIYEIVAGERRWRAAQAAGLERVPAIVQECADKEALEVAIIENVQRQDISALDAAVAYRRLQREFGLSQEDVARRVGKSRAAIANTLRLLDLAEEVQQALTQNQITEGHGRAILGLKSADSQRSLLRNVLRDHLTVRQTEEMVRKVNAPAPAARKNQPERSADERHIEAALQRALGTRVQLKCGKRGGTIVISYFSDDELEGLLERLGV